MSVVPRFLVSFRCNNCGRLHTAAEAGDALHPHACTVCGSGVIFGRGHDSFAARIADPALSHTDRVRLCRDFTARSSADKVICPDNWEVLADASPARLAELGLDPADVCRHVPAAAGAALVSTPGRAPQSIAVTGGDGATIVDKSH